MGMFAYVDFAADCPKCGMHLTDWQTKDPEELDLQLVSTEGLRNWYTSCEGFDDTSGKLIAGCKTWIEYRDGVRIAPPPDGEQNPEFPTYGAAGC